MVLCCDTSCLSLIICLMEGSRQGFMPLFDVSEPTVGMRKVYVLTQKELASDSQSQHLQLDIVHISSRQAKKYKIQVDSFIEFSAQSQLQPDYIGFASKLLASAYFFTRKSCPQPIKRVSLCPSTLRAPEIIALARANITARQLANGRGDVQGSSQFFILRAQRIAAQLGTKLTIIKGDKLIEQGFRMHHAVGRGSRIEPAFINLAYNGDRESSDWLALVGKGVLFDTGGYNLKSSSDISTMFLDKHAACSCLAAFEAIAASKAAINVTCSVGFSQNSIGSQSYRPSDILVSRKGITVKVADTDAEGRLILADAMNWTQEMYKVTRMVEMSTLTYSCMKGLGRFHAGIYANDKTLQRLIIDVGEEVAEECWPMPLTQDHHDMLECQEADCLSDVDDCPGGSIGAAFLQKFVEKGVSWAHLDVLGVSIEGKEATGWGSKLLIQLARHLSK